jgi:hypothetical protein
MTNHDHDRVQLALAPMPLGPARCALHWAFEADYCPVCGTTTPIGDREIGGDR